MAQTMMAHPELRHPFEQSPLHPPGSTTVLSQGKSAVLSETGNGDNLLIQPEDLPQINGFALKPEGVCFQDMCIPLSDGLLVNQDGKQWFDLTAFAELLGQPYVADQQARVWSFADIPAKRDSMMLDAMAPEFEVTDRSGKVIRMSDFKGKKALVVTWSSW